jgi:hypothetical protein
MKYWLEYIITCMCDYRRGFGFQIGFIDPLQIVNTNHNDTIANFYSLQIITAHAKSFQSAAVSTIRCLVTASNSEDSSTTPSKSSLHKFPYDRILIIDLSRLKYLGTDCVENTVHCFTLTVSVGTCLFAKALPSNGCVYMRVKNVLPSSECFVVCFEVITQ